MTRNALLVKIILTPQTKSLSYSRTKDWHISWAFELFHLIYNSDVLEYREKRGKSPLMFLYGFFSVVQFCWGLEGGEWTLLTV
jgi:hypothetical protein